MKLDLIREFEHGVIKVKYDTIIVAFMAIMQPSVVGLDEQKKHNKRLT